MTRNGTDLKTKAIAASLGLGLAMAGVSAPAFADEETEMKVSFAAGVDYNTHFISYGYDVWGGGDDFGKNSTYNPWAEVGLDFGSFSVVLGSWADVNDNNPAGDVGIGGNLQEVDWYIGVSTAIDKVSLGLTFQEWIYGSQIETILDFSIGYDDSELLGDWAMSPTLVIHRTNKPVNGTDEGYAFVFSVEPGTTLIDGEEFTLDVSIPIAVAFGDDEFYSDSGFAYFSIGAQFSVPLSFVPAEYGEWWLGFGLTYYSQDDDALPGNPDDQFFTGNVGISMGL